MHLTRFGFTAIVLVGLIPSLVFFIAGNAIATGTASDMFYWMTAITVALIAFAVFQIMRPDNTMSRKEATRRSHDSHDDVVSFENIATFEYIYCGALVVLAIGSWWFHHGINKDSTGFLAIGTLIWSFVDLIVACIAGFQFYRLKSGAIVEVAKKIVSH